MRRRWLLFGLLAVALAVAVGAPLAAQRTGRSGGSEVAARPSQAALVPLPAGFRYAQLAPAEAAATIADLTEVSGADDASVVVVGTPSETAPTGVRVVVLHFARPPDRRTLAGQLGMRVPLVDPQPRTVGGVEVVVHDGDPTTFSSGALWVDGRQAVLAYGGTTPEVVDVLAALIAGRPAPP